MKNTRSVVKKFPSINWGTTTEDSKTLVLKWGENPYSPPQVVLKEIQNSLKTLNRYPRQMEELKKDLAEYVNLDEGYICLTNGSDKAFRLIAETFIESGDEVISFYPSYPVIDSAVELMGGVMKKLPLDQDYRLPSLGTIIKSISEKTKLIYICNPNNPTGNMMATNEQIEKLLEQNIIVVVDEAYFEFSRQTVIPLLNKYDNLIILRSFSKGFGLAGLRVGYVIASPLLLESMKKVEETIEIFNIATPSLAGAIATLKNKTLFEKNFAKINQAKEKIKKRLQSWDLTVYESQTSFILFDIKNSGMKSGDFCQKMKARDILLKDCSIYQRLDDWKVYTAIPNLKDVTRFLKAVKIVLQK